MIKSVIYKKRILIFGGTFNPIHDHHVYIAKKVYYDYFFDQVWFLPVFKNPFKKETDTAIKHRINIIKILIDSIPFFKLKKYASKKSFSGYLIDLVFFLKKKFPFYNFSFLIGSDQLINFSQWKNVEDLVKFFHFFVVKRSNFLLDQKKIDFYKMKIIKAKVSSFSSTMIRNGIFLNKFDSRIINYINEHLLYIKDKLKFNLNNDQKRIKHSLFTGKTAFKLAKFYNQNPYKAKLAGFFHDITKNWPIKRHLTYFKKYNQFPVSFSRKELFHSLSGALYLKFDLLIQDQDILYSVKNHTLCDKNMNLFAVIVLLADKIEPNRNFPEVKILRKLAYDNIWTAFHFYLNFLKNKLIILNKLDPHFLNIFDHYLVDKK